MLIGRVPQVGWPRLGGVSVGDVAPAVAFQNEDPCFLGGAVREMVVLHGHLLDNVASVQFFTPVVQRPMPTLSVPVLRALVQLGPCIVHYFENFLEFAEFIKFPLLLVFDNV